jgi:hypothetical protein
VYDSEVQLKKLYIQTCKRLPAHGCKVYQVKELLRGKTKKKVRKAFIISKWVDSGELFGNHVTKRTFFMLWYSKLRHRVLWYMPISVSEEHADSNIMFSNLKMD